MPAQGSAAQEGPGVSAGTAFFFFPINLCGVSVRTWEPVASP